MAITKTKQLQKAKEQKIIKDLSKNVAYRITKLVKFSAGKYGPAATVEIDNSCYLYLPKRFAELFDKDEEEYAELQKAIKEGSLIMTLDGENNRNIKFDNCMMKDDDFADEMMIGEINI